MLSSSTKTLGGAKKKLEEKTGHEIKYLAWVFGIYDDELLNDAQKGKRRSINAKRYWRCGSP